MVKVGCIGLVVYLFFKSRLPGLYPLVHESSGQLLAYLRTASFQLSERVVFLFLVLGALDYFYQRYKFGKRTVPHDQT